MTIAGRFLLFFALTAFALVAQDQAAAGAAPLPQITVGIGPSWTRGDVHAASANVNVAVRLGSTSAFSWSTISTPVATVPAGAAPLASTFTTGLGYVAARSPSGSVSLLTLVQTGLNQVQSTGSTSLAITGSAGLAVRIRKTNLYLMPYIRASKPEKGTDGSLVSAIMQPGLMLIYGFGK